MSEAVNRLGEFEIGILKTVKLYGGGLDMSGPRISRKVKDACRDLLRRGFLEGAMKHLAITQNGMNALDAPMTAPVNSRRGAQREGE